jgi:hypothetical protein
MEFFFKQFPDKAFTLYPLGDWHFGSAQCDSGFIRQVIEEIKQNPRAWWVGMGDLMENAIVGSMSDVYTQIIPPKDQMDIICEMLEPIKKKGLFLIAGNHERRTVRQTGIIPEQYISVKLGVPYLGFSCAVLFQMSRCKDPYTFTCYFHHNYGGGWLPGSKINKADSLRKIMPTADAIFSGHFHITSRIPVTWFDAGRKQVLKKVGYDYVTGSALTWNESYAEEKGKPAAALEFIKVTFVGSNSGQTDTRKQIYEVITKA